MLAEEIYEKIEGPKLANLRYIYAMQRIDNGIQFGCIRNKQGANIIKILQYGDKFSIIFMKLTKPKYNHKTGLMMPHSKKEKLKLEGLTIEEVNTIINSSFKYLS